MLRLRTENASTKAPACLPTAWWVSGWGGGNPPRPTLPQAAAARAALSVSIKLHEALVERPELPHLFLPGTKLFLCLSLRPIQPGSLRFEDAVLLHSAYPYRVLTFQAFLFGHLGSF